MLWAGICLCKIIVLKHESSFCNTVNPLISAAALIKVSFDLRRYLFQNLMKQYEFETKHFLYSTFCNTRYCRSLSSWNLEKLLISAPVALSWLNRIHSVAFITNLLTKMRRLFEDGANQRFYGEPKPAWITRCQDTSTILREKSKW